MLPIRLSSFIIMLMFTLLEARDSIVKQPHYQGILEAKVATQSENINDAKFIHQTIVVKGIKSIAVPIEKEGSNMRLNGRKLASKGGLKKEQANAKAKELAKMSMGSRSSKISGATPCSWNCSHKGKRRKLDVLCNKSVTSIPKKKAKFPAGFVALSADYHFPNSHPPRHN